VECGIDDLSELFLCVKKILNMAMTSFCEGIFEITRESF